MKIEYLIANWLLERLKKENLVSEAVAADAKKKFLQNLLSSTEHSELENKAA